MKHQRRLEKLEAEVKEAAIDDRCPMCDAPRSWITPVLTKYPDGRVRGFLGGSPVCEECGKALGPDGKGVAYPPKPQFFTRVFLAKSNDDHAELPWPVGNGPPA